MTAPQEKPMTLSREAEMTISDKALELAVDALIERKWPSALAIDFPVLDMLRADARAVLEATFPFLAVGRDALALEAAKKIEDIFSEVHQGGATQRRAKIQCVIIALLAQAGAKQEGSANPNKETGR